MSNNRNIGLKIIASIAIFFAGYQFFVRPIANANTELEIKYLKIILSKSPIERESQIKGKFKSEKYYKLKTKEYPEFDFIVSGNNHKYCNTKVVDIPSESNLKIGISLKDYENSKNKDKYWNKISVFEIKHLINQQEIMYLSKEIEEERRIGVRKYLYPFSIIMYLLFVIILFTQQNEK